MKSRDPSPATSYLTPRNREPLKSREPSPAASYLTPRNREPLKSRDPSPVASYITSRMREPLKSRDPSPAATYRTPRSREPIKTRDAIKSRDPSPVATYLAGRTSREPSPADRYSLGGNGYASSTYTSRLHPRRSESANYDSPKFQNGSSATPSRSAGAALSYMTASDATARCVSQRTKRAERKQKEREASEEQSVSECDTTSSEPNSTVQVSVVSRGTSPNPPLTSSSSTYVRSRRTEVAKTIEKTINRSTKKPESVDKEIQSDRMDDTTKYSRFSSSRVSPWSTYTESKYIPSTTTQYSRYTNGSTTGSTTTKYNSAKNEPESVDTKPSPTKSKENSPAKPVALSRSGSGKTSSSSSSSSSISSKSEKSKSTSESKSKTPPKQILVQKQKTPDSSSGRSLPPQAPKSESPAKTVSSSTSSFKWTNKDFRKSALNVGPTDRPRKSGRTSSIERDHDDSVEKSPSVILLRSDRSTSNCSEVSTTSVASTTNTSQSEDDANNTGIAANTETDTSPMHKQKITSPSQTSLLLSTSGVIDDLPTLSKGVGRQSNDVKTGEAKSFLIRALEPVTNLFKSKSSLHLRKHAPNSEDNFNATADENNSTSISESLSKDTESLYSATAATNQSKQTADETDHHDPIIWMNNNNNNQTKISSEKPDFGDAMKHTLRHIDSGEIAWWMNDNGDENEDYEDGDNDDTLADDDLTLNQSEMSDKVDLTAVKLTPPPDAVFKIRRIESGEKAWWLNGEDSSSKDETNSSKKKNVINGDTVTMSVKPKLKICHVQSGERAWWMSDTNAEDSVHSSDIKNTDSSNNIRNTNGNIAGRKSESSERAWWLNDDESSSHKDTDDKLIMNKSYTISRDNDHDNDDSNGGAKSVRRSHENSTDSSSKKSQTNEFKNRFNIRHVESGEKAWWMQDESGAANEIAKTAATSNESADDDDDNEDDATGFVKKVVDQQQQIQQPTDVKCKSVNYDELGDRASPEGLEDTSNKGRTSPYDNVPEKNAKSLFISRHTNIDDLLGGSCHPLSPMLLDRFTAAAANTPPVSSLASSNNRDAYEEISPAQVRIHDGTAQMPIIQRASSNR